MVISRIIMIGALCVLMFLLYTTITNENSSSQESFDNDTEEDDHQRSIEELFSNKNPERAEIKEHFYEDEDEGDSKDDASNTNVNNLDSEMSALKEESQNKMKEAKQSSSKAEPVEDKANDFDYGDNVYNSEPGEVNASDDILNLEGEEEENIVVPGTSNLIITDRPESFNPRISTNRNGSTDLRGEAHQPVYPKDDCKFYFHASSFAVNGAGSKLNAGRL